MLVYYTSVTKKEEWLRKMANDAEDAAESANEMVCNLKSFAAHCLERDLEGSIEAITQAQENIGVVSIMLESLKNNIGAYAEHLAPKKEQPPAPIPPQPEVEKSADPKGLSELVDAIKTLKELGSAGK